MRLLPPCLDNLQDRALHEDVRLLASALGNVIRRLEGEEYFQAVERLRVACRSRRHEDPDAPGLDELLARVRAMPLEMAAKVARAFTLFFVLINAAEQVHRVRDRRAFANRADCPPLPGSCRWAMERLRAMGKSAEEVASMLSSLEIRPVLTAHPTESTRSSILTLQERVADCLIALDEAPFQERLAIEESLEAEVELLWLTAEVRPDRLSVLDEVSTILWYLKNRFLDAGADLIMNVRRAYREVYVEELRIAHPLRVGSWVGGDRDGNPNVTPEITVATARRNAHGVIGAYRDAVDRLTSHLSLSSRIKPVPRALEASIDKDRMDMPELWERNRRRNAEELIRLKLSFIAERLDAVRREIASRDVGAPVRLHHAYKDSGEFERDLLLVRDALISTGASTIGRRLLEPLLSKFYTHGFHGFLLDVREDAGVHEAVVNDLAQAVGLPPPDREALSRELLGRRPLLSPFLPLEDRTKGAIQVFRAIGKIQDEFGEKAASTYIVSMSHSPEDLLRVLLLGRETGLVDLASDPPFSRLGVTPLFETLEGLVKATPIMRSLFSDPAYRRQLQARGYRQEVMVGYSDSAKDVGLISASWALYRAQEELAALCREEGVSLTLFHGRGGTVGRGGGSPVLRGILALPPGTVQNRIKVTEQGEVISQKYGLLPIAERTLEVMLAGTLVASVYDWRSGLQPGEEERYREVMDRLSDAALPVYRRLVHEDDRLFKLFLNATPVRELAHVHFGSRPAYRETGAGTMKGIRAIPWMFGWTQMRLNLPSWLGAGTALSKVAEEPGGLEILQRMARKWCFFDDLLAKIEMVCAKTDLDIARLYIRVLREEDLSFFEALEAEFQRTVKSILQIRQTDHLLEDSVRLQTAIVHREPYLDPLSLLQVELMRRKKTLREDDPQRTLLDRALASTLNGLAQGMRNTG